MFDNGGIFSSLVSKREIGIYLGNKNVNVLNTEINGLEVIVRLLQWHVCSFCCRANVSNKLLHINQKIHNCNLLTPIQTSLQCCVWF